MWFNVNKKRPRHYSAAGLNYPPINYLFTKYIKTKIVPMIKNTERAVYMGLTVVFCLVLSIGSYRERQAKMKEIEIKADSLYNNFMIKNSQLDSIKALYLDKIKQINQ